MIKVKTVFDMLDAMMLYTSSRVFLFQVCLPLVPNSPRQLQLDNELNAIMTSRWNDWMHSAYYFIHHHLRQLGNTTDAAFNLTNHLRIQYPRNPISALLTRCSP